MRKSHVQREKGPHPLEVTLHEYQANWEQSLTTNLVLPYEPCGQNVLTQLEDPGARGRAISYPILPSFLTGPKSVFCTE